MADTVSPSRESGQTAPLAQRYIELLRRALLNETALEAEVAYFYARQCVEEGLPFHPEWAFDVRTNLADLFGRVEEARRIGRHLDRDLAKVGFSTTMIGRLRLENIESCIRVILEDDVSGDLIECGVWRGGGTIFMRGVLAALGVVDRLVWVADSFQGLPAPNPDRMDPDLAADRLPQLAVSIDRVKASFERFGLLDDQVRFLEGWFEDTLPDAPIERLSLLRLDGDYYDSTMQPLEVLYDKVSPGGFVVVDDYSLIPACKAAVDDFRAHRGIASAIEKVDDDCVFWRKSGDMR